MSKIKAICCDAGRVVVDFKFDSLYHNVSRALGEPEDIIRERLMLKASYDDYVLKELGKGIISFKDFFAYLSIKLNFCSHYYNYDSFVKDMTVNMFTEIKEMTKLLFQIKQFFHTVIMVTNNNDTQFEFLRKEYPHIFCDSLLFDEIIASHNIGFIKPERQIFELTLAILNRKELIRPEEVIFIDDLEENIIAATEFGFGHTFYFDYSRSCSANVDALKKYFIRNGVLAVE